MIDDDSPDGTGAIADRLAAELDWVEVLHRERKEASDRVPRRLPSRARRGAELVIEMDCDLSHDPADVPRLLAATEGGPIWSWARATSRAAPLATGALLRRVHLAREGRSTRGSCSARDARPDGRVQVLPARVLETIDLDAIHSRGYAFQIETTYRAVRKGFRVVEVPIRSSIARSAARRCPGRSCSRRSGRCRLLRLAALRDGCATSGRVRSWFSAPGGRCRRLLGAVVRPCEAVDSGLRAREHARVVVGSTSTTSPRPRRATGCSACRRRSCSRTARPQAEVRTRCARALERAGRRWLGWK